MKQLRLFGDDELDLEMNMTKNTYVPYGLPHSFMSWAGGKARTAPQIARYLPPKFTTYYEPFLGAGGVFWLLHRRGLITRALLSDIIPDLVLAWNAVKYNPYGLLDVLKMHIRNDSKDYHKLVTGQAYDNPLDVAGRFIYVVTKSYRSKMEYRRGAITPAGYGSNRRLPMDKWNDLGIISNALTNASITLRSYEEITPSAGDLVYLDPPYDFAGDKQDKHYYSTAWQRADLRALRDFVCDLSARGVLVMLSNRDTSYTRELFGSPPFRLYPIMGMSNMGGAGGKRGTQKMNEILVTNYTPTS